MTARLPAQMCESEILAEHAADEARVLEELLPSSASETLPVSLAVKPINMSVRDAINAIRDAARCPDCGKTRAVINLGAYTARARTHAERVSIETHCSCEGGPAHHLLPPEALDDLSEFPASSDVDGLGDLHMASASEMTDSRSIDDMESPSFRSAMIDAGRGGLLR